MDTNTHIHCGVGRLVTMLGYMLLVCFVFVDAVRDCNVDKTGVPSDTCAFDLRMRGAKPSRPDQYLCSGYNVAEEITGRQATPGTDNYIVRFEALADANKAHHILVYGCSSVQRRSTPWACGSICGGGKQQILFAWAKNAPPLSLPKDVGRMIGGNADINYIVIQVHYVHPLQESDSSGIRIYFTQQPQQYLAGIYLMLSYRVKIPPNTQKTHADISCNFNWGASIIPFGYRTHAHSLGQVISGYKERNGLYSMIGKGNPQWPQAFYPVKTHVSINPGDRVVARCTFNSTGRNRYTNIGSTSKDEMCNFYIMYYMNATDIDKKGYSDNCAGNNIPMAIKNIPKDSDTPLPRNEMLESEAAGHHHSHSHDAPENEAGLGQKEAADPSGDSELEVADSKDQHKPGNKNDKMVGDLKDGEGFLRKDKFNFAYEDGLDNGFLSDRRVNDVGSFNYPRKPQQYLYDYPPDYQDSDYYSGMRSRNRNVKKPYYDVDDLRKGYMSDFSGGPYFDKQKSSLSRNRNKIFDAKYDDYASELSKDSPKYVHAKKGDRPIGKTEKGSNSKSPVPKTTNKGLAKPEPLDLKFLSEVGNFEIGQVGGLAVNEAGELHIFHRGSRVWNSMSFDPFNNYKQRNMPVETDAIIILNKDGSVKRHFGKNRYFLPHGLSLDKDGNIWITDVALHQVFRIPFGKEEPDMQLGIRFESGKDDEHFCKPSDVAVLPTGEFFVSDGYCNTRIMKFDKNGYFLKEWGSSGRMKGGLFPLPGTFNLPHGLTLAEDKNLLCVADRENGRIQCFDYEGNFVRQMHPNSFGKALYALEYCPKHGGVLFAVNGPEIGPNDQTTQGFTLDINTGVLLSTWNLPNTTLKHPHDVTVDTKRHLVYVGELNPAKVWKFEMSKYLYTVSGAGESDASGQTVVNNNNTTNQHQTPTEKISMTTKSNSDGVSPRVTGGVAATHSSIDIVTVAPVAVTPSVAVVSDTDTVDVVVHKDTDTVQSAAILDEEEGFAPSLIIGTLLVVPVVLLILITVLVRLYNTGHFESCRKHRHGNRSKFNLGNFLNSHKGFDRLSTEDDDHDLENALDDSDNEEFSIVRKA